MPKKPPRKTTPPDVETAILAKSARRCALCFHLDGDLKEKLGQIAHLDGDRSNAAEDNLAFMCLPHHSLFDSTASQHKNYTIPEVKAARSRLYDLVTQGKHLRPVAAQPYLAVDADKRTLADFLALVPSTGSIDFLRTQHFAGSYRGDLLNDLHRFIAERGGPDHEFLDAELEASRKKFRESCKSFLAALGKTVQHLGLPGIYRGVPPDWKHEAPQRFDQAVNEIHNAADAACSDYDELVRLARRKLAV